MSTRNRTQLSEIMSLAWQFVKRNGYTMSEALKTAWANMKLKVQMKHRIVRFYFRKVDGTIREAYGTRKSLYYRRHRAQEERQMRRCKRTMTPRDRNIALLSGRTW